MAHTLTLRNHDVEARLFTGRVLTLWALLGLAMLVLVVRLYQLQVLEYERLFFSLARRVELDKQGRVRLPDALLSMVDVDRDVVLIGVKDHLEIHDRNAWYDHRKNLLADRPQLLMNPRRLSAATRAEPTS